MKYAKFEGITYRPGTHDIDIIRKDSRQDYAGLWFKGRIIMDIGANIGAFAVWAMRLQAKGVICYEPELENYRILLENMKEHHRQAVTLNRAIVFDPFSPIHGEARTLYLADQENAGRHSLVPFFDHVGKQWTTVESFANELERWRPDTVKIDIEGGEYGLLEHDVQFPRHVRQIAIEYHLDRPEWRNESAPSLHHHFILQGFECQRQPVFLGNSFTATSIYLRGKQHD